MLKFDKLKIVSQVENIEIFDETKFEEKYRDGEIYSLRFQQKFPSCLSIEVRYDTREVIVEFTGKILGADYPKLISIETIRDCFNKINDMGFCKLDPDAMMEADVVKCDVTQDVNMQDMSEVVKYIKGNLANYQKYSCRVLRSGTLVLEKNVVTNRNKKRMILYDKGREMRKSENKDFVEANGLDGKFEGICRFELNLNTKEQVRDALELNNTKLKNVLTSTATPIGKYIAEAVVEDDNAEPQHEDGWKMYWQGLILKDCGYDLERVEAKLRQYKSSRNSHISKCMEPFRALMQADKNPHQITKQELLKMLSVSN